MVNANDWRETRDLVHIGALHGTYISACVGGESLHIAALTFGKNGVKSEGGLATTRQTRNDHKFVSRDTHIYILEVVNACASDKYVVIRLCQDRVRLR